MIKFSKNIKQPKFRSGKSLYSILGLMAIVTLSLMYYGSTNAIKISQDFIPQLNTITSLRVDLKQIENTVNNLNDPYSENMIDSIVFQITKAAAKIDKLNNFYSEFNDDYSSLQIIDSLNLIKNLIYEVNTIIRAKGSSNTYSVIPLISLKKALTILESAQNHASGCLLTMVNRTENKISSFNNFRLGVIFLFVVIVISFFIILIKFNKQRRDDFDFITQSISEQERLLVEFELAKEELKESEEKFSTLINESPIAIELYDSGGTLRLVNKAWKKLWNRKGSDFIHKYNLIEDPKINELGLKGAITNVFKGNNMTIPEVEYQDENNTKYLLTNYYSIKDLDNHVKYVVVMNEDITDRKLAEIEKQKSEDRYQKLYESSNDAIYLLYNEKFEIVNKKFIQLFGYELDELNSSDFSFRQLIAPESIPVVSQRLVDISQGKKVSPLYEFNAITKDGRKINCETSVTYIDYKDGIATQGIIRDRSEQKRALKALRDSEVSYRELFNNAQDAIYIQDTQGRFITVNRKVEQMYGYDADYFVGKTPEFLSAPDKNDLGYIYQCIERAFQGIPQSFEFWGIRNNGEVFPKLVRLFKGNYLGEEVIIAFGQDITKQKIAERELKSLAAFANLNPSPVMRFQKDGKITYANSVSYIIFNENELLNRHISELLPFFKSVNINDYINSAKINNFEYHVCGLDFVFCIQGVSEFEVGHIYGNEITDRKRAEQKLIKAREKAESSDKLKSEFLAQMSHEIRTPINTILSFTSLIKEELESEVDDDLAYSFLGVSNAGRRIIRTVDLLLNMSEIQTGSFEYKPRQIDLGVEVINNLYDEYLVLARDKGLKLNIIHPSGSANIFADEYSVHQIFANLIDNAIKYTQTGSVTIKYIKTIEKVSVEISDTGIGISSEYLPHLFEQFSQEDQGYTRKFEGNGLGLALVKNYCDVNKADIFVSSEKGKGTTFTVDFPYLSLKDFS